MKKVTAHTVRLCERPQERSNLGFCGITLDCGACPERSVGIYSAPRKDVVIYCFFEGCEHLHVFPLTGGYLRVQ